MTPGNLLEALRHLPNNDGMGRLWQRLEHVLSRGRFVRNVAVLGGGTALAQCFTVIASPFLTRLYTPEDLGKVGLYMAFVGFTSVAASLRYESAITAARDTWEAAYLAIVSIFLVLPTSLLSATFLYFLVRLSLLGFGRLPQYTTLFLPLSLFLTTTFVTLRYWLIRQESFALISQASVFQHGARAFSQVGLGISGLGWMGLLLGDLVGRGFALGRVVRSTWRAIATRAIPLKASLIFQVMHAYRKFPIYSLPSSLIDIMALTLPLPLISRSYGHEAAGHFTLVQTVLSLPLALVGGSVADAFFGRVAVYARQESHQARPFFLRTARALFVCGVGPGVVLMLFGPSLFGWVFGERWGLSGVLAAYMAPWALAGLVVSPLSRVVFVFQRQELKLMYDVGHMLAVAGVLIMGPGQGLSLVQTIGLLSLVNVLAYGVYFVLLLRVVGGRG